MKSYTILGKFINLKYSVLDFFKKNQIRVIFVGVIALVALVTGIFSAVKFINGSITIIYSDFGIKEFIGGSIGTSAMFFQRFVSYGVVVIVLCFCSMSKWLFPIGTIVIVYRSFLLGLNVTFIVVLYGVSGIITGLLIILPLQLLMLGLIVLFYVLARDRCLVAGKYGAKNGINLFVLMLIFLTLLSIVNLAETFILVISSAKVILII